MFKKTLLAAALIGGMATSANATLVGSSSGPDDSFSISLSFLNTGPEDIVSMTVDGSSTALSLVWDDIFSNGGTADDPTIGGIDTSVLTFSWLAGGFASGDTYFFSLDPDTPTDSSFGAIVLDLLGTTITAIYGDGSTFSGTLIDDLAPGMGLVLEPNTPTVPLPGALPLLALGLGTLGLAARRRNKPL